MLKYVGNGFIAGIPARDLEDRELTELEREHGKAIKQQLIQSGLYIEVKATAGGSANKALRPEIENKRGEE